MKRNRGLSVALTKLFGSFGTVIYFLCRLVLITMPVAAIGGGSPFWGYLLLCVGYLLSTSLFPPLLLGWWVAGFFFIFDNFTTVGIVFYFVSFAVVFLPAIFFDFMDTILWIGDHRRR